MAGRGLEVTATRGRASRRVTGKPGVGEQESLRERWAPPSGGSGRKERRASEPRADGSPPAAAPGSPGAPGVVGVRPGARPLPAPPTPALHPESGRASRPSLPRKRRAGWCEAAGPGCRGRRRPRLCQLRTHPLPSWLHPRGAPRSARAAGPCACAAPPPPPRLAPPAWSRAPARGRCARREPGGRGGGPRAPSIAGARVLRSRRRARSSPAW